jgi:hypothetical protein
MQDDNVDITIKIIMIIITKQNSRKKQKKRKGTQFLIKTIAKNKVHFLYGRGERIQWIVDIDSI